MEIYKKLFQLQQSFKSTKDQKNNFGGYMFRNYEQMLTTLKPMLKEKELVIISKEKLLDNDYLECTLSLIDINDGEKVETSSIIKIDTELKGLSKGQMTGAILSYARKYTAQSLLGVDDGKDLDSLEPQQPKKKETTQDKIASILDQINECNSVEELKALYKKIGKWSENVQVKSAFTARKEVLQ